MPRFTPYPADVVVAWEDDDDPTDFPDSALLDMNNPLRFWSRLEMSDDEVDQEEAREHDFLDDEYQGDWDCYEQDEEEPPWAEGEDDIP